MAGELANPTFSLSGCFGLQAHCALCFSVCWNSEGVRALFLFALLICSRLFVLVTLPLFGCLGWGGIFTSSIFSCDILQHPLADTWWGKIGFYWDGGTLSLSTELGGLLPSWPCMHMSPIVLASASWAAPLLVNQGGFSSFKLTWMHGGNRAQIW